MRVTGVFIKEIGGEWYVMVTVHGSGDYVLSVERADMLGDLLKEAAGRADAENRQAGAKERTP